MSVGSSAGARARVHLVAAARPNFMKVAPLFHALAAEAWAEPLLVHGGQHYAPEMSGTFLAQLGLPEPAAHLEVGSGSHAEQTARAMTRYEALAVDDRPDWVVVVGDVNVTMAVTLAAVKVGIPVAHLEAGLRSGDRTMPEEINRIVTDAVADLLWAPSADAVDNLLGEGRNQDSIELVGNVMIDSFELLREQIDAAPGPSTLGLGDAPFAVVTLHRPVNVDDEATLVALVEQLEATAGEIPMVWPVHPRTAARLAAAGLDDRLDAVPGIRRVPPLGYIEFMALVTRCRLVITDSGGVQEETSYLGIPCITVRDTTERPITVTSGTNRLVAVDAVAAEATAVLGAPAPTRPVLPLWDGRTAARVVDSLRRRVRGAR